MIKKRATILMYHILDIPRAEQESKFCCLPERFSEQMAWIAEERHPISMDTLIDGLDGNTELPETAVAVTFDDGFSSTYENAMPVLSRYGISATMYMVADRVGMDNDWMHCRGMPKRSLMDAGQIREMHAAKITIGSHTLTHPKLPECMPETMSREISDSKSRLEDIISSPVHHFAYPYGLYNKAVREIVLQAGYRSACSTQSGFNNRETDRYQLRRIEVFGNDRLWQIKQKLKFGTNEATLTFPAKYFISRARSRISGKG